MKRVVIVGGGITGLACAHALEKAEERPEVHLVESSAQLGGNLQTVRHNAFVIDAGPDSWIAAKPEATKLARAVGLGDELIGTRPDTRRVYIVWQRKLHPMPEGMMLGVPTEVTPFLDTRASRLGRESPRRASTSWSRRRKWKDDDDESIGSFVSRRLGGEVAERIAGPLLGGIFAGDPDALSVRACVPQLVEAEREHGSIIRAMRALKAKRKAQAAGAEATAFVSLKRGLGDLVLNVAHKLRDAQVATNRRAKKVVFLPEGDARGRWMVKTSDGAHFADDVVLAVPAHVASGLLTDVDAELAAQCGAFDYSSAATIFLAYRKFDVRHPLDAFGILIPRAENRPILACTFVSSKWDHRAPSGQVLMRVFVGGAGNEEMVDRDDKDLIRIARGEILDLLGIDRAPVFARVFRFRKSSPQPHVGHIPRVKKDLTRARRSTRACIWAAMAISAPEFRT